MFNQEQNSSSSFWANSLGNSWLLKTKQCRWENSKETLQTLRQIQSFVHKETQLENKGQRIARQEEGDCEREGEGERERKSEKEWEGEREGERERAKGRKRVRGRERDREWRRDLSWRKKEWRNINWKREGGEEKQWGRVKERRWKLGNRGTQDSKGGKFCRKWFKIVKTDRGSFSEFIPNKPRLSDWQNYTGFLLGG